ncbi:MAG: B12-binding domain-containing radical SAM protein [Endomicrobiales bacterium]
MNGQARRPSRGETGRKKVVLVQLPAGSFLFDKNWGNVPLAAGYLKAAVHARGLLEDFDIEILNARSSNLLADSALISLLASKKPHLLGFTLYSFNSLRSLYILKEVKRRLPATLTVVGGPEVSKESRYLLREGAVDLGCVGEGEDVFCELLEAMAAGDTDYGKIQGVFLRKNGKTVFAAPREKAVDIQRIPSPFLLGYIDPRDYGKVSWETFRGCRFNCSYCTVGLKNPRYYSLERIEKELQYFRKTGVRDVILCDSSFVTSPLFDGITEIFRRVNKDRKIDFWAFTYAEHLDDQKMRILKECNFVNLGIGLQSINRGTLRRIDRRIAPARFLAGLRALKKSGINFFVDIILGLPGDTYRGFQRTLKFLKAHGVDKVNCFQLLLFPGSRVREKAREYGITFNRLPPYQLIEAGYLSKEEIQKALERQQRQEKMVFRGLLSCSLGRDCLLPGKKTRALVPVKRALRRNKFNKMMIDLDSARQSPREVREAVRSLSAAIYQPFTLWTRVTDPANDAELVGIAAGALLEDNPFLILNVVIESPRGFPPGKLARLRRQIRSRENAGIGWVMNAVSLCLVLEHGKHGMEGEALRMISEILPFYFSLKIGETGIREENIRALAAERYSRGIVVDFAPQTGLEHIRESLERLARFGERARKEVHFRDLAMIYANRTRVYQTMRYDMKPGEHLIESVVSVDRDLEAAALPREASGVKLDLLEWQRRFNGKEQRPLIAPVSFDHPYERLKEE